MPTYRYKPYYAYYGATRSDPFRDRLSDEEVQRNTRWFYEHLDLCFANTDAVAEVDDAGVVSVTTGLSEDQCSEIIKGHLNTCDLFAHRVRDL